jgi:hypothetical protein
MHTCPPLLGHNQALDQVPMANLLAILRWSVFCIVIVFSIIVLGVGAHVLDVINGFNKDLSELGPGSITASLFRINSSFAGLAVATAVLTLVSVVVMGVVDHLRKHAVITMPIAEMCWFGFLWILWLAAGAHTIARASSDFGCSIALSVVIASSGMDSCSEIYAIAAFSFLNWLTLMGYTTALLVVCVFLAFRRGQTGVWYGSVKEIQLVGPHPASGEQEDTKVAPTSTAPQYYSQPAASQP